MATTVVNPVPLPSHFLPVVATGLPVFIDTNILIYATTPTAPLRAEARTALDGLAGAGVKLWISRQIIREYLAAMTRPQPFAPPGPLTQVLQNVQDFHADFRIAEDGPAVTAQLLGLLASVPCGGKQVHDANIVATMLAHGIPNLLTHNVGDFTRFAPHITVVPLVPVAPTPGVP